MNPCQIVIGVVQPVPGHVHIALPLHQTLLNGLHVRQRHARPGKLPQGISVLVLMMPRQCCRFTRNLI